MTINLRVLNFSRLTSTAFSLLTGAGNPDVSAKVFSTFAFIKAMALVLKPVQMTQKLFGVDVGGEGKIYILLQVILPLI